MLSRLFNTSPSEGRVQITDWSDWGGNAIIVGDVTVDQNTAMQLMAVAGSVRYIADTISTLPVDVYRRTGARAVEIAAPPWVTQPSIDLDFISWCSQVCTSLLLHGNAYVVVVRKASRIVELNPVDPQSVTVTRNGRKLVYMVGGQEFKGELLHIRGMMRAGSLVGMSPLEYARQSIGLGLAAQEYSGEVFQGGANMPGVIELPGSAQPEIMRAMANHWRKQRSGKRNRGLPGILEGGAVWKPNGITPEQGQFLQCVVAGTLFTMANGTRRLVETLQPGDEVMAWEEGKLVASRVAAVGAPPVKPLVRVRTARGRELIATADHPALVRLSQQTRGGAPATGEDWVAMGDLVPGNHVRVALGSVHDESTLSREEGYFLGAMVGDGYIRSGACGWTSFDQSVTDHMSSVLSWFGGSLGGGPNNWTICTGGGQGGSPIRDLLNRSGLVGSHSHDKFVPDVVMSGGRLAWQSFLSGLFDADGSVRAIEGKGTPAAYISSTSRRLLDECQHLLALLGIQSAVYPMHGGGRKMVMGQECDTRPSWGLYVMGVSQLRLLSIELDLAHAEKRRRLAAYMDAPPSRYRQDIFDFDRVVEVEHLGEGATVGIEIEGCHTHVTGGLITHNTRQWTAAEIAGMVYLIDPSELGIPVTGTSIQYGNMEQRQIATTRRAFQPWMIRIEKALSSLLAPDEFVKFNLDGLLRADSSARWAIYKIASEINQLAATQGQPPVLTTLEMRDFEDLENEGG